MASRRGSNSLVRGSRIPDPTLKDDHPTDIKILNTDSQKEPNRNVLVQLRVSVLNDHVYQLDVCESCEISWDFELLCQINVK